MVKMVHRFSGKVVEFEEIYAKRYSAFFKPYVAPKKRKVLPKKVVESKVEKEVKEDKE